MTLFLPPRSQCLSKATKTWATLRVMYIQTAQSARFTAHLRKSEASHCRFLHLQ
uniref:Uncharacterized protein n=1 Tax=Physcomitrium patens TaxID=3218 RepID=A0A2K1JD24_PHYPA|nr:hypothetical protein PHYPA_019696 [Physcomitrium patens]